MLQQGRRAFAERAWEDAYLSLSAAEEHAELAPDDLLSLSQSAYLTGRDDESSAILERAHHAFLEEGGDVRAARCAFWLGMMAMERGEVARGSGWLGRARRIVGEAGDSVVQGYLLVPVGLQHLEEGDADGAFRAFRDAASVAARFDDRDLTALARLGLGQAAIRGGDAADGLALLDEVMISVEAGEVSPIPAGIIYCAVISTCNAILDLRRAHEWTVALSDWCEAQPDLVPYRGQCLVHRAEIMQLHGEWSDAMREARLACEQLTIPPGRPAAGAAHYQRGELHRLRGDFAEAEEAYRQASQWGHTPQPGVARLRLAQGRIDTADAAIRQALSENLEPARRADALAARAEIALAADDATSAREAAAQLSQLADDLDAPLVRAASDHVAGAVALLDGDASEALTRLRRAWKGWRGIEAPYEAARVRVLIGLACRRLDDEDGALMELDAAREVFERLGAAPELSRLDDLFGSERSTTPAGLTDREVEVLRLVATGKSNRAIASELVISEHTVARHVQNIFTKLHVSSRTAAAAFAFEHELA